MGESLSAEKLSGFSAGGSDRSARASLANPKKAWISGSLIQFCRFFLKSNSKQRNFISGSPEKSLRFSTDLDANSEHFCKGWLRSENSDPKHSDSRRPMQCFLFLLLASPLVAASKETVSETRSWKLQTELKPPSSFSTDPKN